MTALSRITDLGESSCPTTGHGAYTTTFITGAKTVFTNNLTQTTITSVGDQSCGHQSTAITGSETVFAENLAVHRIGDIGQGGAGDTYTSITGSPNVFNNGSAGSNIVSVAVSFSAPPDKPVRINRAVQARIDREVKQYIENPDKYRINTEDESGGPGQVKGNYAGTPDHGKIGESNIQPTAAAASDILPLLTKLLNEANRGLWRESGQKDKNTGVAGPSNPNIVSIWKNLGYPQTGAWLTDQTAWCMGFVNYVLKNTGYRYLQTAWALDIKKTSEYKSTQITDFSQAQPGDIALWSYRHVNFVYSNNNGRLSFVGGNQAPKDSNNPKDGSITRAWPNGYLPPANGTLVAIYRPSKS